MEGFDLNEHNTLTFVGNSEEAVLSAVFHKRAEIGFLMAETYDNLSDFGKRLKKMKYYRRSIEHSGTYTPQSMHLSGSMVRKLGSSWKQSMGQTSTQSVYLQRMQVSVTTWAICFFEVLKENTAGYACLQTFQV